LPPAERRQCYRSNGRLRVGATAADSGSFGQGTKERRNDNALLDRFARRNKAILSEFYSEDIRSGFAFSQRGRGMEESGMSLGTGIVLFVIGAILVFATDIQLDWINLDAVGYILMIAGIVGVVLGVVLMMRRRQTVSTTRSAVDPASGEQITSRSTERDPLV
jgi:Domain of unknown function (DUF6458)